jgi:hypothetical protein
MRQKYMVVMRDPKRERRQLIAETALLLLAIVVTVMVLGLQGVG